MAKEFHTLVKASYRRRLYGLSCRNEGHKKDFCWKYKVTHFGVIATILCGIIILWVAFDLFWTVIEFLRPFAYQNVSLTDIHDHIEAIFRRGFNRSQMLIVCEQNGKEMCFRKAYRHGHFGITFRLIVPTVKNTEPRLSEAIARIEALGLVCSTIPLKRDLVRLEVDCFACLSLAKSGADIVLRKIICVTDTSTFKVQVKGDIFAVDGYIGGETTAADVCAMYWCEAEGKERPYKWAHYFIRKGRWAKSFGEVVGRVAAKLFPPRR